MKKTKRSSDINTLAFQIVKEATEEYPQDQPAKPEESAAPIPEEPAPQKNPAAVALGRLGGLKGGKARANKLDAERRKEIAKKAAKARWEKLPGN